MGSLSGLKLVEAVAAFLKSEAYTRPIQAFVERECLIFETADSEGWATIGNSAARTLDTGEGFSHALSEVQVHFSNLASSLIEKKLHDLGGSWDKLQSACVREAGNPATKTVRNTLEPCTDFRAFFDMMAECNLALEAKALELWHMQTQFGFDEDDIAAEAGEGGDMPAPLPSIATLCNEYGLSEVTMREIEAARAEMDAADGGGGGGGARSLAQTLAEDDDDGDPLALLGPPKSRDHGAGRGVGGACGRGDAGAHGVAGSAPVSPRPEAPSIQVSASDSLGAGKEAGLYAEQARHAVKDLAAGAGPAGNGGAHARRGSRDLKVSAPPSPTTLSTDEAQSPGGRHGPHSTGSEDAIQSRRVPASIAAGPLSAPAKQSAMESPRISKPGDPDYDENTTLQIGNSRWKIGRQIGRGATARVFLAVDMDLHRTFAVKQILCGANQTEAAALTELEREIAVMKRLSHPNLVRYLGTERTEDELYIAMEYVRGGALADLIKRIAAQQSRQRQQREAAAAGYDAHTDEAAEHHAPAGGSAGSIPQIVLPLRTIASYTAQVLNGLAYLHEQGVIHRDIKSANILVDATYQHVKIADFGSSRVMEPLQEAGLKTDGAQTLKGTPFWMSPEVIQGTGYGTKADVWSVGCVCVEMLTGRPPWSNQLGDKAHPYAIMYHIVNASEPPQFPGGLSETVNDVMHLMFERDQTKRPSAREMLQHSWLANALPVAPPPPPRPFNAGEAEGHAADRAASRPAPSTQN